MKKLKKELQYQYFLLKLKLRELKFKMFGVNRNFYCQSDIEGQRQCKFQCEHCKKYYKPLEGNLKN